LTADDMLPVAILGSPRAFDRRVILALGR